MFEFVCVISYHDTNLFGWRTELQIWQTALLLTIFLRSSSNFRDTDYRLRVIYLFILRFHYLNYYYYWCDNEYILLKFLFRYE